MKRNIKGCDDCPFCDINDMAPGYTCNILPSKIIQEDSKTWMPITPEWCPLKISDITISINKDEL